MAKKLKSNGEDSALADPKHNVRLRESTIQSSMEGMFQADKSIKAALERHVTPHREDKNAIKKKLREDLELTTAVINARYSNYVLQRKAEEAGDDRTLDLLREMYDIVPLGSTADMLAALEEAQAEEARA